MARFLYAGAYGQGEARFFSGGSIPRERGSARLFVNCAVLPSESYFSLKKQYISLLFLSIAPFRPGMCYTAGVSYL